MKLYKGWIHLCRTTAERKHLPSVQEHRFLQESRSHPDRDILRVKHWNTHTCDGGNVNYEGHTFAPTAPDSPLAPSRPEYPYTHHRSTRLATMFTQSHALSQHYGKTIDFSCTGLFRGLFSMSCFRPMAKKRQKNIQNTHLLHFI